MRPARPAPRPPPSETRVSQECELNRALACGVALAPSQNDLFDFLSCVEARAEGDGAVDPEAAISACAAKGGMLERRVLDCFQGAAGGAAAPRFGRPRAWGAQGCLRHVA